MAQSHLDGVRDGYGSRLRPFAASARRPGYDFLAEEIAAAAGIPGKMFDVEFAKQTIKRAAAAAHDALVAAQPATHIGHGVARVDKVASNRRILGPDGKVRIVRWSKCEDPEVRALPEGTIDPNVRMVSFWQNEKPLAVLSYYTTHPQSYYRTGKTSADFVGLARSLSEAELRGALQIHFNGASGNVTAGKYNDGSHEARLALADRLADGMKRAWNSTEKELLAETDLEWETRPWFCRSLNGLISRNSKSCCAPRVRWCRGYGRPECSLLRS
jgi:hypothetical protein